MGEYEMLESGHGGVLIAYNGYLFRKQSQFETKASYWTCSTNGCPVKGTLYCISGKFQVFPVPHTHPSREDYISMKKSMVQLSLLAKNSSLPAEVLIDELGITENVEKYRRYIDKIRIKERDKDKTNRPRRRKSKCKETVGTDYEMVPSKQKKLIVHCGFTYRQYKANAATATVYWRCIVAGCHATAKTDKTGHLELTEKRHNHQSDEAASQGRIHTLREAAKDITRPLVEIFSEHNVADVRTKRLMRQVRSQVLASQDEELQLPIEDIDEQYQLQPESFTAETLTEPAATVAESLAPTLGIELKEAYTIDELLAKMEADLL